MLYSVTNRRGTLAHSYIYDLVVGDEKTPRLVGVGLFEADQYCYAHMGDNDTYIADGLVQPISAAEFRQGHEYVCRELNRPL